MFQIKVHDSSINHLDYVDDSIWFNGTLATATDLETGLIIRYGAHGDVEFTIDCLSEYETIDNRRGSDDIRDSLLDYRTQYQLPEDVELSDYDFITKYSQKDELTWQNNNWFEFEIEYNGQLFYADLDNIDEGNPKDFIQGTPQQLLEYVEVHAHLEGLEDVWEDLKKRYNYVGSIFA